MLQEGKMPQKDWNAIEWVLESCLPEREYDPSRTSLEEQQELRKLMAPRIDPYLRSVEADLHLMGDYMIESLLEPKNGTVFFYRLPRFLPIPYHAVEWYDMFYLESGMTTHFVGSRSVVLSAGDLLIIPPGVKHCPAIQNRDCTEYAMGVRAGTVSSWAYFKDPESKAGRFFESTCHAEAEEGFLLIRTQNKPKAIGVLKQLFRVPEQEDERTLKLMPLLLEAALGEMERFSEVQAETAFPSDDTGKQAVRYISRHFSTVTMQELEQRFSCSGRQLTRYLKEETGKNFIDFRTAERLRYITDMLVHTEKPVVDIIEAAGFHHNNFFYTLFDSVYHMTPTAYRERKPV